MSREANAHKAVQALIPDDEILDVALTYPRGFTQGQAVGMAIGGLAGGAAGDGWTGVGMAMGSVVGGQLFANLKEMPPSIVLAISPTAVYTFGRDRTGIVGGWDSMVKMVKFDRSKLGVEVHQRLVTLDITLTDTEHDVSLRLESKRLGSLDAKALVELLRLSSDHVDDADETEAASGA